MKQIKMFPIIIGFVSLVLLCLVMYFWLGNKTKYTLNLPIGENIESISLESKTITDKKQIEEVINILNKENRTTKTESIQDSPINVSENIKIDFHFINGEASTLFIYQKNKHYYIEQPYNGIYKITEEEYKKIKNNF